MHPAAQFRRKRWLCWMMIALLTALSLSWIFSFRKPFGFSVGTFRRYGLYCDEGTIQFRRETRHDLGVVSGHIAAVEIGVDEPYRTLRNNFPLPPNWTVPAHLSRWRPLQATWIGFGGNFLDDQGKHEDLGHSIEIWGVTHWAVAVPLLLLLWRRIVLELRARRVSKGLCPACGYDLRATPDRCPECGWIADKHAILHGGHPHEHHGSQSHHD